jgi:hypothetical protein
MAKPAVAVQQAQRKSLAGNPQYWLRSAKPVRVRRDLLPKAQNDEWSCLGLVSRASVCCARPATSTRKTTTNNQCLRLRR